MLNDMVEILKRKIKILYIVIAILGAVIIGLSIFAFSEFEIVVEETTTYETQNDIDQNASIIESGNIEQDAGDYIIAEESDNTVFIICGTVIVCLFLIIGGVLIYGKSKSTYNKTHQDNEN